MQKSFDVQGPVELEVRIPTGQIEVDTSLEGGVEVELVAHDDESQRLLDDARIELSDRHGRPSVLIDVPQKRGFGFSLSFGRSGISCRIRCPKDSGLSVRTKSADTIVRGTLGGLNAQGASGDVEVDTVTGGVNVKSASGDFSGREVGAANVQTASGDISIEIARGPVNVQSASGDVSIDEAYDNVSATTVSGDQSHGAVMQGTVQAQAVSGDVEIAVRRGSKVYLDCSTLSGDTHSELELTTDAPSGDGPQLDIQARTVSGDIRITRAPAPTNNDTQEVHA